MTAKHCYQTVIRVAVILCAFFSFISVYPAVAGELQKENEKNIQYIFQQDLQSRSQKYLETISFRSNTLFTGLKKTVNSQSQFTVNKGFKRLNRSSELVQNQTSSINWQFISNAAQKTDKKSAWNTAEFLSNCFYCPTELEVVINVALPQWNRLQYPKLIAYNPFACFRCGLFGLDAAYCNAIVAPATPRCPKSLTMFLGQLLCHVFSVTENTASLYCNVFDEPILTGYPLIAQTVIRRE